MDVHEASISKPGNNQYSNDLDGNMKAPEQRSLQRNHELNSEKFDELDHQQSRDTDDEGERDNGLSTTSDGSADTGHDRDVEKNEVVLVNNTVTEPRESNIVDWDGPDDPDNPQNWSHLKQWLNVFILSLLTLVTPLASSMFAPSVPQVLREFDVHSETLATWIVSVYILGFAAGPLLVAPLSEMYGRVIVYNVCNVFFLLFTIACALAQSINQLIVFRFFAGAFGISPITNGGGTIADMMKPERRGGAMAIWAMGPLLGPVIGPAAGGFLSQAAGWRWIFWLLSILSGVLAIATLLITRETYAATLLKRKTKRLQRETGNMQLRSKFDENISVKEFWKRSLLRPLKLMTVSLICALMSLHMAAIYGILYLLFTTFTFVFEDTYGFSQSIVGLVYIGLGVGMIIGLFLLGALSDRLMQHLAKKHNGGVAKPEYRLPPLIYMSPFIPAGLFIYGWSAQYHVHWFVPIFGTALVGIGLMGAFMCINTYLIDAFTVYAASALAANTILRSILGAVFPLFGLQMYNSLGLGWGNSLLGFLTLALCFVPIGFYRYGEAVRTNPRLAVKL